MPNLVLETQEGHRFICAEIQTLELLSVIRSHTYSFISVQRGIVK
jgi:hypothetical protein